VSRVTRARSPASAAEAADIDSAARTVSNSSVRIRRAAAWISTAMVALVVVLAVPASQLRIAADEPACCCPDPASCRCADHQEDPSSQPSLRACHDPDRAIVAHELPAFGPPALAVAAAPGLAVVPVDHAIIAPHPAPPPARPDAPS
jgi:hypothetical protein